MRLKWKLSFGIAAFNDLIDILGVGSIPIIGDVIDLVTSALLWKTIGRKYTAPTFLELVPGLDVLPIYLTTVSYAYYKEEKQNRLRQKGMRHINVN